MLLTLGRGRSAPSNVFSTCWGAMCSMVVTVGGAGGGGRGVWYK